MSRFTSRRRFLKNVGIGSFGAMVIGGSLDTVAAKPADAQILGAAGVETSSRPKGIWKPVSDRKIRVGIVGHGRCKFGAAFGFQDHPNVTVAAVSDLIPERCAELAKACRCDKTYPSLEEMAKDDTIEAIYVATDAPSHATLCIEALRRGKHVASAVPAVFGSLEDAEKLIETVRSSGKKYMLFETSAFRPDCYAMRQVYQAGAFGKLVYSEGEYYHDNASTFESFRDWRIGLPPQWYPTHSNAYYICTTGGSFTDVACTGMPSLRQELQPANNRYGNPFGTEIGLLRTSEGGMARMAVSWDTPGVDGECGRVRGQQGSMSDTTFSGDEKKAKPKLPSLDRPPLPPNLAPGGHGGSHGFLTNEFVTAILENREPFVDIVMALNLTVPGIVAHQSALKDGERMKIPQYR